MNKYKINIIYSKYENINNIVEKALIKELKKYLSKANCKKNNIVTSLNDVYLNQNKDIK